MNGNEYSSDLIGGKVSPRFTNISPEIRRICILRSHKARRSKILSPVSDRNLSLALPPSSTSSEKQRGETRQLKYLGTARNHSSTRGIRIAPIWKDKLKFKASTYRLHSPSRDCETQEGLLAFVRGARARNRRPGGDILARQIARHACRCLGCEERRHRCQRVRVSFGLVRRAGTVGGFRVP